jgi:hypothetical protein
VLRILILIAIVVGIAVGALFALDWQARRNDQVRIIEVPFDALGTDAITTGRIIFVQSSKADSADLLAHELVHVCQWEQNGIEFLWDYASEYSQNLAELKDIDAAYVELSFEQEARLGEVDCDLESYMITE